MNRSRILLVDDDCLMTYVLRLKLEEAGLSIEVVGDGVEALESVRKLTPDVVITDLQMPEMDGYTFACELRKHPKTADIPIILLTGRGHIITREAVLSARISHVVPKPFSAKDILQMVLTLLDSEAAA